MTTRTTPPRTVAIAVVLLLVSYAVPDIVGLIKYGSIGLTSWVNWGAYVAAMALILGLARTLWLGWPLSRWLAVIIMAINLYNTAPLHDEFVWNGLRALWLEDVVVRTTVIALLTAPAASRRWFAHVRPSVAEAPSATDQATGSLLQIQATAIEIRPGRYQDGG